MFVFDFLLLLCCMPIVSNFDWDTYYVHLSIWPFWFFDCLVSVLLPSEFSIFFFLGNFDQFYCSPATQNRLDYQSNNHISFEIFFRVCFFCFALDPLMSYKTDEISDIMNKAVPVCSRSFPFFSLSRFLIFSSVIVFTWLIFMFQHFGHRFNLNENKTREFCCCCCSLRFIECESQIRFDEKVNTPLFYHEFINNWNSIECNIRSTDWQYNI